MIHELLGMYDAGKITAHHMAVECLHRLDSVEPDSVLVQLPDEVLASIQEFASAFDSQSMKTNYGVISTQAQVSAATKWIRENNAHVAQSE
jgi:hypothetical protein